MQLLNNQATIKDVKIGTTLYKVYALKHNSRIESMTVVGEVYLSNTNSEFVLTTAGDISLHDAGLLPNRYNNHKTFTTLLSAEMYLALCK